MTNEPEVPMHAELLFLCLKCEAHYSIQEPTDECPVCGWRKAEKSLADRRAARMDPEGGIPGRAL